MNKKVFVLLSLPFVLASCHGQAISRETAKEILAHIEEVNDDEHMPFSVFTLLVTTDEEANKGEQKHFYSIPDRYYHSYTCLNGAVSEEWNYVQADADGVDHIYNVIRIVDKDINEETAPRYAITTTDYTDEAWEEMHNHYARILLSQTTSIISSLKAYLESEVEDESTLVLESYGSDALYAKRTIVDESNKVTYEKEAEFEDNNLVKYSFKSTGNPQRNRSYSVSYSSVEIFYPKIN